MKADVCQNLESSYSYFSFDACSKLSEIKTEIQKRSKIKYVGVRFECCKIEGNGWTHNNPPKKLTKKCWGGDYRGLIYWFVMSAIKISHSRRKGIE